MNQVQLIGSRARDTYIDTKEFYEPRNVHLRSLIEDANSFNLFGSFFYSNLNFYLIAESPSECPMDENMKENKGKLFFEEESLPFL